MRIQVARIGDRPIISPDMDARMGSNVNGPSLIKVPDWLPDPLGRYYLYFAHHDGRYIRLAFADELTGPWQTYEAGVLPLEDSLFAGHIASPDVIVDDASKAIRLYFHGADQPTGSEGKQYTRVALSSDGLNFVTRPEVLGRPYMRVIQRDDWHYAMAMPGIFYRSRDGLSNFEEGPNLFESSMRHAALHLRQDCRGDRLLIFFTQVGDVPEHIVVCEIELTDNWHDWRPGPVTSVLMPERDYEGAGLALQASVRGLAPEQVRELRDPAIFEEDGKMYLLYAIAGESGIALAELDIQSD